MSGVGRGLIVDGSLGGLESGECGPWWRRLVLMMKVICTTKKS